jgi:tetratricopeptide (TPR) repeat protein
MRTPIIIFVIVGAGIAGAVVFLSLKKAVVPPLAQIVQSQPPATTPPAPTVAAAATPKQEPAHANTDAAVEPAAVAIPTAPAAGSEAATPIHKAVDALLSAKSAMEKHNLFQQLVQSGQIDQAIDELKQRVAANPSDPEIPTTLGEAQLNKVRALKESGGDINDMGILAMQADQSFNAALKLDPQNWEAQFMKSSSMYYWPADPARDNDVVQRLSGLIDQQQTMPAQPQFAQTYVVLGNEYLKIGQPDKAMATWQLGAQQFPNDPTLQKKISGQP